MKGTRIPSTAFADAWINVDSTEDPEFFVQLLDSTRAALLERARRSPTCYMWTTRLPCMPWDVSVKRPPIGSNCPPRLPREVCPV